MSINVLVRKKPDRDYYQMVYVDPVTRKDRTKSAKTNDLAKARLAAAKWQVELESHGAHSGPVCWDSFVFRFRGEHLAALSHKTKVSYTTALNTFVRINKGKPVDMNTITAGVLSEYKGKLLKAYKQIQTVRNYLRHLISALAWAKTAGIMRYSVTTKLPKADKDSKLMRGRPITAQEFEKLIETCNRVRKKNGDARRYYMLLWGMRLSGLRMDEAVKLNFDKGPVRLDMHGAEHPRFIFGTEGHKGRRRAIVPCTPDFVAFIKKEIHPNQWHGQVFKGANTRSERHISAIGQASGIIVNEEDGKYVSAQDMRRMFGTFWSYLVLPVVLQQLMRHKSVETTLEFYVSQAADDVAEVVYKAFSVPHRVPKKMLQGHETRKTASKKPGKKRVA